MIEKHLERAFFMEPILFELNKAVTKVIFGTPTVASYSQIYEIAIRSVRVPN